MTNVLQFTLEDYRVKYLSESDYQLSKLIQVIGDISLRINQNYYESLIKKIIGQQLSVKAARTICERVEAICGSFDPTLIKSISDIELRKAGVSRAKILYIRDVADKVLTGEIDLKGLDSLSDEEVISTLTKIKGIGKWTAEMFLIFSLGRLNVLSLGDVSIQRAFRWLNYGKEDKLESYFKKWNPYNTIASLYMWEAVNRGFLEKYETIDDIQ